MFLKKRVFFFAKKTLEFAAFLLPAFQSDFRVRLAICTGYFTAHVLKLQERYKRWLVYEE